MSLERDAERGRNAEAVLANPVYIESYELLVQALTDEWRSSSDPKEREHIHQLLRVVDKVKNLIATTMREGQIAANKLKRDRTLAERVGLRRD